RLIREPPPRLADSLLRHGMPFRRDKDSTPRQRYGTERYDDGSTRNNTRLPPLLYTLPSLGESWHCNIPSFPWEPPSLLKLLDMGECHAYRVGCSPPSSCCNNVSPLCSRDKNLCNKTSTCRDDVDSQPGTKYFSLRRRLAMS